MHLPNRWTDYTNSGEVIVGTPFVAFKTPLSKNYDNRVQAYQRFGPSTLQALHPNLAVVIDLTDTNRYYKFGDIEQLGIDYVKIRVPGKMIPREELVLRFFKVADNYRASIQNGSRNKIIGVHCTHGLNRTGYFICRYLIERMGLPPQDAISKFERARGHTMERSNYVEKLKSCIPSYHGPKESILNQPEMEHIPKLPSLNEYNKLQVPPPNLISRSGSNPSAEPSSIPNRYRDAGPTSHIKPRGRDRGYNSRYENRTEPRRNHSEWKFFSPRPDYEWINDQSWTPVWRDNFYPPNRERDADSRRYSWRKRSDH